MSRVLVEGGARVFASFFLDGLVDRVMVFINPRVLGAAGALGPVAGPDSRALADAVPLEDLTVDQLGPDVLLEGRLGKY
jgi:diaminohydroxyphosphoribosylaminopyrimidine deaminase/5-amino-6-(5-phosphoribosylamino)uracil reductase